MGGASWWRRSRARACAPGKTTYGNWDSVLPLKCSQSSSSTELSIFVEQWLWLLPSPEHLWVCEGGQGCQQNLGAVSERRGGRASHCRVTRSRHLLPASCQHAPCKGQTNISFVYCRYRKVPSDKCEGGFSPQLAEPAVVRPCGIKPSPGPQDSVSIPISHFDTPVSRCVVLQPLSSIVWFLICLTEVFICST